MPGNTFFSIRSCFGPADSWFIKGSGGVPPPGDEIKGKT
jgi:hypothetical protein